MREEPQRPDQPIAEICRHALMEAMSPKLKQKIDDGLRRGVPPWLILNMVRVALVALGQSPRHSVGLAAEAYLGADEFGRLPPETGVSSGG